MRHLKEQRCNGGFIGRARGTPIPPPSGGLILGQNVDLVLPLRATERTTAAPQTSLQRRFSSARECWQIARKYEVALAERMRDEMAAKATWQGVKRAANRICGVWNGAPVVGSN
jgi:hypothetical protein